MRFLVDEDLPRSTDSLLRQHGHEASLVVQTEIVNQLNGKLAIIEPGRIRIRKG